MSYIKRVLADRPLGFWNLDSTSDLTDGDNDIVIVSRPNAITEVISLNTSTYKDKDTNNFIKVKGLLLNSSADLYVPNVYNILGKGLEHLSFGIEFWFTIPPSNTDDNQNLIQFHELGNNVDQTVGGIYIYADTIYFSLNGSTKTYVVSKQLTSKDSQIHVFATYSNKTMSIYVNGILGQTINLPEDFEFVTEDKTNVRFQFKYESNPTLFNSLAIYNRALLDQEIKSHIYWGLNDGTPVSYVKGKNVSVIDINENINNYWYTKNFNNKSSFSEGSSNNIVVDSLGITLPSGPYINTENSKTKINSISSFLNTNNFSISGTLDDWSALASNFEILRLDGFDLNSYLSLIKSSNNKLRLNYVSTSETTTLIETGAVTSTNGKFIFSIDGSHASIYINGAGSFFGNIIPVKNSSSNLYFPLDTEVSTTFSEYIDIFNKYVDPNAFINDSSQYTDSLILSVDREGNYVKKKGYWEYVVPASLFYNIVGSRISWDSATNQISKNITSNYFKSVYVEIDRGSGWEQIKNGMGIENFQTINDAGTDFKIRITLLSSFYIPNGMSESIYQPRLENLSISLYKDLSVLSDDSKYKVVPYYDSDNNLQHTYTLKNNNLNILSRSNNFGIKLNEGSAAAIINSTSNEGKKSLEFWFRPDIIGSEQDQYILDTQDSNEYIKFDKDTKKLSASIQETTSQWTSHNTYYKAQLDLSNNLVFSYSTDGINWTEDTNVSGINCTSFNLYHNAGGAIDCVFITTLENNIGKIYVYYHNVLTLIYTSNTSEIFKYTPFPSSLNQSEQFVFTSSSGNFVVGNWQYLTSNLTLLRNTSEIDISTFIYYSYKNNSNEYCLVAVKMIPSSPPSPPTYNLVIIKINSNDFWNNTGTFSTTTLISGISSIPSPNSIDEQNLQMNEWITEDGNVVYSGWASKKSKFFYMLFEGFMSPLTSLLYKIDTSNNTSTQITLPSISAGNWWQKIIIKGNDMYQNGAYASYPSYTRPVSAILIPAKTDDPIKYTSNIRSATPTWTNLHTFTNSNLTVNYINFLNYIYVAGNSENLNTDVRYTNGVITGFTTGSLTYLLVGDIPLNNSNINTPIYGQGYRVCNGLTLDEIITGSGFKKVYINSQDLLIEDKYITSDEPMHIAAIYEDSNFNNVYLNKNTNLDGNLSATYGYISVYPNELSASDVNNRYISFLTNNVEVINKSNSIGTLSEYSDGDAIVAYSGTSKQSEI